MLFDSKENVLLMWKIIKLNWVKKLNNGGYLAGKLCYIGTLFEYSDAEALLTKELGKGAACDSSSYDKYLESRSRVLVAVLWSDNMRNPALLYLTI